MDTKAAVRLIEKRRYTVIQLLEGYDRPESVELRDIIGRVIESPRNTIVGCAGIRKMSEKTCETIHFLEQQLKVAEKHLRLSQASTELRSVLADSRFGKSLLYSEDLLSTLEEFASTKPEGTDPNFIKTFVNATLRTFFVQAKVQASRGKIYSKTEDKNRLLGDISGVVKLTTHDMQYVVVLSFPKDTFLNLLNSLLDEKFTEITSDNQDGAVEFLNIILGQAKLVLNEEGNRIKLEPTQVRLGGEYDLVALETGKTMVVPFHSSIGDFFIEVWLPEDVDSLASV